MTDDDGKTENVSVEDVVTAFRLFNEDFSHRFASETLEEREFRLKGRAEKVSAWIKQLAAKRAEAEAAAIEDHPQL